MISTRRLSDVFVEMADTLIDDFHLEDFLQRLTDNAAEVSGAKAVGLVLAVHPGALRFVAASNGSGKALQLFQLQTHEGPSLDCFSDNEAVVNADLAHAEDRWPQFAPRAVAVDFESVHALPMRLRQQSLGALTLFGGTDTRFNPAEVQVVQALADVAMIVLSQKRSIERAETLTEQLQGALDSRILIEQAKGALAQMEGISVDEAFQLLRDSARSNRRKLVDVAAEVLDHEPQRHHSRLHRGHRVCLSGVVGTP